MCICILCTCASPVTVLHRNVVSYRTSSQYFLPFDVLSQSGKYTKGAGRNSHILVPRFPNLFNTREREGAWHLMLCV